MSSMRAAIYERFGPAAEVLKVVAIERPEPGPGEVRVRVAVSGVNPTDWKRAAAAGRRAAVPELVPNQDGAGVIDAVGDGRRRGARRRAGLAVHGRLERPDGTAAEYICCPRQAVPLPDARVVRPRRQPRHPRADRAPLPHRRRGRPAGSAGALDGRTVLVAGGAGCGRQRGDPARPRGPARTRDHHRQQRREGRAGDARQAPTTS